MAEGKEGFILYKNQRMTFDLLTDEDAGRLIKLLFSYISDENPPIPNDIVGYGFATIKAVLKADLKKWEDTRQKRIEAGRLGGLAKSSNANQCQAMPTKISSNSNSNSYSNSNGIDIKENNNNIIPKEIKRFKKPTIQEIEEYCTERQNGIDAENFYNYYESKGWVVGKSPMKDWKACVRTWEQKNKPASQVQVKGLVEI